MQTALSLAAALLVACGCTAQRRRTIPTRPITLVVPYAAGGGNDVMARIVGEKMSKTLGQQIVIENRAGAGGSIATRAGRQGRARRLHAGDRRHRHARRSIRRSIANVGYDPRKDFAPVGLIGTERARRAGAIRSCRRARSPS